MKKILFILAAAWMAFGVTACADEEKSSSLKDNEIQFSEGGFELPEDEF